MNSSQPNTLQPLDLNPADIEAFRSHSPNRLTQAIFSYLHAQPVNPVKKIIAGLFRKLVIKFSQLPVDVEISDLKLRCFFTDNYSEKKFAFTPWKYDAGELQQLTEHLPEDGTFVDIGANVGLYTLSAARHMSSQGLIMAFEPNPPTLKRLLENISFNQHSKPWPQIKVLDIGIADKEMSLTLNVDESNLGASSIKESNGMGPTTSINCRPLIDVLKAFDINHIDVLKIDIEGAEDIALVPFLAETEDSLLPKLIIIENSQSIWSTDLFEIFYSKGYSRVFKSRLNSVFKLSTVKRNET